MAYFRFDAGLKYPENEQLGVDVVIPNMDYLENSDSYRWGSFDPRTCGRHCLPLSLGLKPRCLVKLGSELTIELAVLSKEMTAEIQ